MEIPDIYVHDGRLLRVVEDTEQNTLTMEVELPRNESSNDLVPRLLVFEEAYGYQVFEGPFEGCPAILDMQWSEYRDNGSGCASAPMPATERCIAQESKCLNMSESANPY